MKIFDNVLNLVNRFRKGTINKNNIYIYSRFEEFLFFIDENDENYPNVKSAVELCDIALKIATKRVNVEKKYKEYTMKLQDVACYEALDDDETEYLKELISKFVSLTKERNILRYKIGDFPKALDKLVDLEDDAKAVIKQIEEAEENRDLFEQDLIYIKEEKSNLEEESEKLKFALEFIYRFTIGMVIFFAVVVMTLVFLNVFNQQVVFFPLTILCFLLFFLISLIYFFKRKITSELKINRKKQAKAVGLINRKTVVYAYYINFLNYEYEKFNVKSADRLKANIEDFKNYKSITSRYDSIRSIMFQTQKLLEDFLREKNIKDINASIESFAKTIDIDDKVSYSKEISAKRQYVENELEELDKKHNAIWEELTRINVEDKSENKIIEQIIKSYLNEVEKLTFSIDNEENMI